jgi:hypothetical protein
MTDLINPAETHVHLPNWAAATELHPAVGERTRNLMPYTETPPSLRRPHATGETPVYEPETIGVVDPPVITGEILTDATEVLFAAALEGADEPLVEDVPDEDLVPGYASGSDERPPTLPTPPHPKPSVRGRRRAGGRAPWPPALVFLSGMVTGTTLQVVTVWVIVDRLQDAIQAVGR